MKKNPFLLLTLSNGKQDVVINRENIGVAMRIAVPEEKQYFTRIIPRGITIDPDTNWLDVEETPEEIARM